MGEDRLVLVTRPEADAGRVVEALAARGVSALAWPLTEIRMTGAAAEPPAGTDALLFTSANGVAAFAAGSARRDLPALCVGPRTAAAAREAGFARVESADGDAAALARLAAAHGARRMFHPHGRDRAGDLKADLAPLGIAVEEAILYAAEEVADIPAPVRAALDEGRTAVITAWSPRNAAILTRRFAENPGWKPENLCVVAISSRASGPLSPCGFAALRIARRPDGAAMIDAILEAHRREPG
ncbi:uroporphyrinogen-III synthase [Limibaculum sp. M0105]|uniref:Uroporphyrinogen-III synthase n=1 Tax=Thermohalobaculum xanthum TaxID=2753746 RepID=A0A8J7M7A5_9RHOB|nr:uroporphyrinogen-III synthase [Thermohalobaculum xanthum]MBK0399911.1 uroporphyrinogen-III synthase [Thermohalobaculum xanthum]